MIAAFSARSFGTSQAIELGSPSSTPKLQFYCVGVILQSKTASANANRRDAAPFWTCHVIKRVMTVTFPNTTCADVKNKGPVSIRTR